MKRKGIITIEDLYNEGMICEVKTSIDCFVQNDVLYHEFEILPDMVRDGDLSKLNQSTREIIALYLEGRIKTKGSFKNKQKFRQISLEDDILRRFRELVPEEIKGTKNSRNTAIETIIREYEAIGEKISYRKIEDYIAKAEMREEDEEILKKRIAHKSN